MMKTKKVVPMKVTGGPSVALANVINGAKTSNGSPDIPVEESLLAKIKAGDKKGIADLKKKSDAGEVIRLW